MSRIIRAIDGLRHRRVVRLLSRRATEMATLDADHVRALRKQARALHATAAQTIAAADQVLGDGDGGTWLPQLPPRTDWVHRPAVWTTPLSPATLAAVPSGHGLGDGISVHHDGSDDSILIRQIDTTGPTGIDRRALMMEADGFRGSFLSLAVGFPAAALRNLGNGLVFRADISMERPAQAEIFARLNLRHGPNTEKIIHSIAPNARHAEFDIYYADLDPENVTDIWLDVIFNAPTSSRLILHDLVLSRHPRANV